MILKVGYGWLVTLVEYFVRISWMLEFGVGYICIFIGFSFSYFLLVCMWFVLFVCFIFGICYYLNCVLIFFDRVFQKIFIYNYQNVMVFFRSFVLDMEIFEYFRDLGFVF